MVCRIDDRAVWDCTIVPLKQRLAASDAMKWTGRYLVEATSILSEPCLIQGVPFSGVQVHDLRRRLAFYDGRVWVTRPARPLTEDESRTLKRVLMAGVGIPYDKPGVILAGTRWLKHLWPFRLIADDRSRFFCVEVCGVALRSSGYLAGLEFNPGAESPRSFVERLYAAGLYERPEEVLR